MVHGLPQRGGGNVSNSGTPTNGQLAQWTSATVVQGFTLGSGIPTALGNALNTASGLVGYSGALGTPTSGVLTNCTGTASGLTSGAVFTISGLIAAGSNITITGSGTSGSPYSIASSGGGGGGSGTVNSGTTGQLAQYPGNGTTVGGLNVATEPLKYLTDGTPQLYKLDRSAVGVDANGIFTTVKFYRVDGTLAYQTILSGGSSPLYTTRTITRYAADGTTVVSTTALTLTYDGSGNLVTES